MKAAGEGETDGNLDQGGSGPGPEDETALPKFKFNFFDDSSLHLKLNAYN